MKLDDEACWRVIAGRDRRWQGRFVVGVRTTGVYCRPGCPAPMPKRKNVDFYACPAAAEEAGFRPCMRCRPETVPGTPAWAGTSATVARALRLIADGALDGDGIDPLAERLGVGGRHLRRLFANHLGASPLAVARTRRVHFARKLIDETDMPLGEIALASGFRSVRRFNDAMQSTFHKAPSAMRRAKQLPRDEGAIRLVLPYRPPFDWSAALGWLGPRAITGVEEVTADAYRRVFRTREGGIGFLEVRPHPKAAQLELLLEAPPGADLIELVERARRLFDLDADPARIARHLRKDPILRPAVDPGMRVPGAWDGFELAVRAIVGQQVSVAGATTLAGRIAKTFGEALPSPRGALTHAFPTAATLATADVRSIGMPSARADSRRRAASTKRSSTCAAFKASGRGPRSTSRCARSASRTHFRSAIWAYEKRGKPSAAIPPRSRSTRAGGAHGGPTPR